MDYNITYRQKDKGWQFIISYKANGKWKQKSKQGFKTKKDAKPEAEKMVKEIKKELVNEKAIVNYKFKDLTLKNLQDEFLEYNKMYKEPNTIRGYGYSFHAFEGICNLKVENIKRGDIIKCTNNLIRSGLKSNTISLYICHLKLCLNYYIENYNNGYINPALNIDLPKNKIIFERKAISKNEMNLLFNQLLKEKSIYFLVAYIAGTCGLRCSEILGLTWSDIDFQNKIIHVTKQWKHLKDGTIGYGQLKTKNSYRDVPISTEIVSVLKKYKETHPIISISNRVAPFGVGTITRRFNPTLLRICGTTVHGLRHSYATLLIYNGVDFKTTAKILGHTVEMTIKTYSHVTDEMVKSAASKIENIF